MEANTQLVRRWYEQVWNQKNEAAIEEMYHPSGKAYRFPEPGLGARVAGSFESHPADFCRCLSRSVIHLEDIIAEGDRVAARWKVDGPTSETIWGFPS